MTSSPRTPPSAATDKVLRRAHIETHDIAQPDDRRDPHPLKDECTEHYRQLRFEEGVARARSDPDWEGNPLARLYVGIGRLYQHRYDEARAEFREAAALHEQDSFKASCLANEGLAYFEQGDFTQATAAYERALTLLPSREFALLGLLYVACQRQDEAAILAAARRLQEQRPDWRKSAVIIETLLKDRSLRLLRETPGLFDRAFDVPFEVIVRERIMTAP